MSRLLSLTASQIGVGVLLLSGCFSYVPAEWGTVPEGEQVRVRLTRQGVADLPEISDQYGPFLSGTLMRTGDDQLVVRVPITVQQDALVARTLGQDIQIRVSQILELERRELNRARTALALAGGVGAAAATILVFGPARNEPDPDPFPPPEEAIRVPLFYIPFR